MSEKKDTVPKDQHGGGGSSSRKRPASTAVDTSRTHGTAKSSVTASLSPTTPAIAAAVTATSPGSDASDKAGSSGGGSANGTGSGTKPPPGKRPDTGNKPYKGLRHFSMMVCKKVEEKGTTTYNEVADELVAQVINERKKQEDAGTGTGGKASYDEKNIRRRVYDALNVLMAMDIITKDKKAITWKGLPTSARQDLDMLYRERDFRMQEIARKRQSLQELLAQQICFRNLVQHNYNYQQEQSAKAAAAGGTVPATNKIPLPFIVVNTNSNAVIQCNMSKDSTDVMFDFNMPFEINDDNTILKRLGMDKTTMGELQDMLPEDMVQYCQQHRLLDPLLIPPPGGAGSASGGAGHHHDSHQRHHHPYHHVPSTAATSDYHSVYAERAATAAAATAVSAIKVASSSKSSSSSMPPPQS